MNVPTSEVILLEFAASVPGAGAFNNANVRYIRITNKDDTNHVQLTFRNNSTNEVGVKLDAGHTYIYSGDNSGGVVATMLAAGGSLTVPSTLVDLVDITAIANTAAVDLEYFVASV